MATNSGSLAKTVEIRTKKISLTKIGNVNKEKKRGGVIGWECAPPQRGHPYSLYLYEGMVLKTSRVRDVQKTNDGVIVKTVNSVYQVIYLNDDVRR